MFRFLTLAFYNAAMVLAWFFLIRLHYWCMEGYVPVVFKVGSFVLYILLFLAGNYIFVRKLQLPWIHSLLVIGITIAAIYFDSLFKPYYVDYINDSTMQLSFKILRYFRDWN